jgi:hypothetical protein
MLPAHLAPTPAIEDALGAREEHFRPTRRIHPAEAILVAIAVTELCALPWAFGGVDPAVQVSCAGASAGALAVALIPRRSSRTKGACKVPMWPRLSHFPVFWAGLALLAYVAVQALNPAYAYRLQGAAWWLEARAHVRWLPAGMDVPFADMNPWREIAIWGSVWALACALWVGITRRSSILAILVSVEANAFAFAVFGIVQRASGSSSIYGVRSVGHTDFIAAIIYRNHAAAFFSLLASMGLGLTIRAFWRSRRRLDPSGPGIINLLLVLTLVVALVLSGSFAAMALFTGMLATVLPVAAWRYSVKFRGPRDDKPVLVGASILFLLASLLGVTVGYEGLRDRVDSFVSGGGYEAARSRLLTARHGWEMFEDRWALGWGAGCFRYGFTKYQKREPELARISGVSVHWEHAHDDWLEALIELGIVGSAPLAVIAAFWTRRIAQLRLWRKHSMLPMLAGLLILALHGLVDFPFQNLAVLASASALLPLLVRWGEIDVVTAPAEQALVAAT